MKIVPLAATNWYSSLIPELKKFYRSPITVYPGFSNTVKILNGELELYLRVMPNMWLTIAVIDVGVNRQQQGIGTAILEWCKQYCRLSGIPVIKIESANTAEMRAFCLKHGFRPAYPQDELCFDWKLYVI